MESFGRGCMYILIGMGILFILAFITQSTITIPWFIFIPLIIIAFVVAHHVTKEKE